MSGSGTQWAERRLCELARIGSGESLGNDGKAGKFPLMGANGVIGSAPRPNFGPGYLVGRVGAAGAVNLVSGQCWASDNTLTLVPSSECDFSFLGHLLRFLRPEKLATKNAQPLVTQTNLGNLRAFVPLNRDEQQRIAEILGTLDEAIRDTERLIAKLKQVRQGLLNDLLTCGIDENGEIRDPERNPEQFKGSPVGRVPDAWSVNACEELCREIVVGIVIRPTQYYRERGIPMLRSANVREGEVVLEDLKYTTPDQHRALSKSAVSPGDLVTVRTGYPGTTAVIPPTLPTANCIDIIISRPAGSVVSAYLAMWVNSDQGKGQVLRRQGGLAQQHFNVGEMKELMVALPSVPEQERIVSVERAISARLAAEEREAAKLMLLKQGLTDDVLSGRVRTTSLLSEAVE